MNQQKIIPAAPEFRNKSKREGIHGYTMNLRFHLVGTSPRGKVILGHLTLYIGG